MATPPRPLLLREAKLNAQRRLLRRNRRNDRDIVIRTPAGGSLTAEQVQLWLHPNIHHPLQNCENVIDVYIKQVCHSINRRRGLIRLNGTPKANVMRAMLSQPHTFYQQILPMGREIRASAMLRAARITNAEFRQLEYFFIPIVMNGHASLVAVSPLHHTIELADSSARDTRTLAKIFGTIVRFLVQELGSLPAPRWRFLHGHSPPQLTILSCGNFTCLAAKVLAGGQPLDGWTDLGQGPSATTELEIQHRVVDDLFHQGGWSDVVFPLGNETIQQRHAPGGHSEAQEFVLSTVRPVVDTPDVAMETRRMVSYLRANTSVLALTVWCRSQGLVRRPDGRFILRMQGHAQWALGTWSHFLFQIDQREALIRAGQWP